MNNSELTRFQLGDLFVAIAFFALLEMADYLTLWITGQFTPGLGSIPVVGFFFIVIVVLTFIFAGVIRNVLLGVSAIVLFYSIIGLRDIVHTDARPADVAITCAACFLVHAGAYVTFAFFARG
jgi:hypothetical protein